MRTLYALLLVALCAVPSCTKNYYPAAEDPAPTPLPTPVPDPLRHTIEFHVLGTSHEAAVTYGSTQTGSRTSTRGCRGWRASRRRARRCSCTSRRSRSFWAPVGCRLWWTGRCFERPRLTGSAATSKCRYRGPCCCRRRSLAL